MSGRRRVASRGGLLLAERLLGRRAEAALVRPRFPQQRVGPQDRRTPRGRGRTQTDSAEKPSGKKSRRSKDSKDLKKRNAVQSSKRQNLKL